MTSRYADLDRPPLDAEALRRAVTGSTRWREVVVRDEVVSTNAEVAELARAGAAEGVVVVAEHQSGGRGRLGRSWQAPPRSGLTVSVLLRPEAVPTSRWPWLGLLAGVAVAEAVRRCADVDAVLKWPNDVLVGEEKLAGILLERVEHDRRAAAVVGVGLNVTLRPQEVPAGVAATSLARAGGSTTDRAVVLREVLRVLDQLYGAWVFERGRADTGLAESYRRRCSTLGRRVRVQLAAGAAITGVARRVDEDGRLVLAAPSGEDLLDAEEMVVGAGDVVHLRDA
ncbi:MAG: biotin--[acetyl-CoA-carboxylase] ligase [Actinomycetota bacterium]|nr:biotin--[acetyl-CoA-carboxylase] ligase [Actinomycetota bacterium]